MRLLFPFNCISKLILILIHTFSRLSLLDNVVFLGSFLKQQAPSKPNVPPVRWLRQSSNFAA